VTSRIVTVGAGFGTFRAGAGAFALAGTAGAVGEGVWADATRARRAASSAAQPSRDRRFMASLRDRKSARRPAQVSMTMARFGLTVRSHTLTLQVKRYSLDT
jgi:hypothetical protein